MSIVTVTDLAKFYGGQDVFDSLSFHINLGDKIALIGPNGVGKTTLLRILCGLEVPDAGTVSINKSIRIGYLPQVSTFTSQRPLYEEMLTVFAGLQSQRQRLRRMEAEIEVSEGDPGLLEQYGKALERFELAGGYEFEHRVQRVLSGLGLGPEEYEKPVDILSGGQKTRAQLAKLLLEDPNLLILDEPTNHLDLDAIEWLEKYLAAWPGSLVVVAHDRYFLDKVVTRVLEMAFGHMEEYRGNYSHYVLQREERVARRWKEYEEQQEFIAKTEDFVRRFKAGQRSKEARGRLTRLERLERIERPRTQKEMHLPLEARSRSGNEVLMVEDAAIGYPGEGPLFTASDLLIYRLERIALLGPNGSGKTTFLKTILGELEPLSGEARLGSSVRVGYLSQGYEDLDEANNLLDEIRTVKPLLLSQARSFLGRFLFSGDDVFKPISALSGGERGRVALAKLALQGANVLLLDEPTSHLDIPSREVLESVLADFNGTILFVSHDRYFMDALATHIWAIEDGVMRAYEGNYFLYAEQRDAALQAAEDKVQLGEGEKEKGKPRPSQAKEPGRNGWLAQQERARHAAELEGVIAKLEAQLQGVELDLAQASMAQDAAKIRELGMEHAALEQELHDKLAAWAGIDEA